MAVYTLFLVYLFLVYLPIGILVFQIYQPPYPIVNAITAFWAWRRFSA